jgi:hypothetical protein
MPFNTNSRMECVTLKGDRPVGDGFGSDADPSIE